MIYVMPKERDTQAKAWFFSMSGLIAGAVAVLFRWLQIQIIFEEETGLPKSGTFISILMMLWMIAMPIVLWLIAGLMPTEGSSKEPEEALAAPNKEIPFITAFLALGAGAGAFLLFLKGDVKIEYIAALLGLLSIPALATFTSLPRWGGFGATLSVIPVVFFSLWLVVFYKTNAVNPVVWDYGPQILAITGCLYAAFRLCGYLFYRIEPRKTIAGCCTALGYSLMVLTDNCSIALRLIVICWGVFFGIMSWIIVRNFSLPEENIVEEY